MRREGMRMSRAQLIEKGRSAAPDPCVVPDVADLMALGSIVRLLAHRPQTWRSPGEELPREELTTARATLAMDRSS